MLGENCRLIMNSGLKQRPSWPLVDGGRNESEHVRICRLTDILPWTAFHPLLVIKHDGIKPLIGSNPRYSAKCWLIAWRAY
jgi:hypothetical protein